MTDAASDGSRDELRALLGIDSLDPQLLERALTHRSYAYENGGLATNERLEFLGDSVLGVVITESLYLTHPDLSEGRLAKLRAAVVNARALAEVARTLGLGDHIRLGRGEEATGGRGKSSILSDTVEAVIGAVYLDQGFEVAGQVVHRLFDPLMAAAADLGAGLDWKTSLQELASDRNLGVPEYLIEDSGPDHEKTFIARVRVRDSIFGHGVGKSKKEAEQQVAETAWHALQHELQPAEQPLPNRSRRPRRPATSRRLRRTDPGVPELPEVEVVRRGLAAQVVGRRVEAVSVLHPRPLRRHPAGPDDFSARLVGCAVEGVQRRGKYLWLALDSGDALLGHLGMSGQLLVVRREQPPERHLRVVMQLDEDLDIRFVDQRMFGGLLLSNGGAVVPPEIAHIALDPLDPAFSDLSFVSEVRRRRTGIKRALLDQNLISGVGNIYADEALWASRLHYARPTRTLRVAEATRVLQEVRAVMERALGEGGTSFDSLYVNVNGESGYFARSLAVYGREGLPCLRCGTAIRRDPFMNRSSYTCPSCQRRPRRPHP